MRKGESISKRERKSRERKGKGKEGDGVEYATGKRRDGDSCCSLEKGKGGKGIVAVGSGK